MGHGNSPARVVGSIQRAERLFSLTTSQNRADNERPMEVRLALLADAANIGEGGKLNVLGIFNEITVDSLPYQHSLMFLVVRFDASPAEFGRKKEIELTLLDPDGKNIGTIRGEAEVPRPEGKTRAHVEVIMRLQNVPFAVEGNHEISILVGGEQKFSLPLSVVKKGE